MSPGLSPAYDLSQPLAAGVSVFPGDPPLEFSLESSVAEQGYNLTLLHLGSHTGTHMDVPAHLQMGGKTMDDYPVSRFLGQGVILDLRGAQTLGPAVLNRALLETGGLPPGGFALLWTGWDRHFASARMLDHPYLALEGAHFLAEKGASLVGMDTHNVDSSAGLLAGEKPLSLPVHEVLLGADVLIVENLRGLEQLGAGPVVCALLPLPLVGLDGSPVRAIAWKEG